MLYVKLPGTLIFHDGFNGCPCASPSARPVGNNIRNFLDLIHGIGRAYSSTTCDHYRNVRKVIAEIHHVFRSESISEAEILKVFHLVP